MTKEPTQIPFKHFLEPPKTMIPINPINYLNYQFKDVTSHENLFEPWARVLLCGGLDTALHLPRFFEEKSPGVMDIISKPYIRY